MIILIMQSFHTCANLLSILEINFAHCALEWNQANVIPGHGGVDGGATPPLLDGLTPPFRKSTPRMTLPPSEFGTPNFRHLTHPL